MKILAFDTAGPALSVAVTDGARTLAAMHCPLQRGHAELLLPAIAGVLQAARLRLCGVDAIATTVGPGSFTGLRTGLAAAQGLSLAMNKPLVGISRFEALAEASGVLGLKPVVVAMDSKARSLYVQAFAASAVLASGWLEEGVNRPADAFADVCWPAGAVLIGDGAAALLACGVPLEDTGRRQLPAAAVAACARRLLASGLPGLPPQPLYLSAAAGRETARRRAIAGALTKPMTNLLPLTSDLAEQAAKIHAAAMADGLGGEAWGAGSFRALLGAEGTVGWIAEGGGVVLARAIAGEAEILTIGVHPAARRRGLARALLGVCYAVLPAMAAERLLLEVAVDNAPALALYRSEGFAAVGRRTGYYRRGPARIDALVMARNL